MVRVEGIGGKGSKGISCIEINYLTLHKYGCLISPQKSVFTAQGRYVVQKCSYKWIPMDSSFPITVFSLQLGWISPSGNPSVVPILRRSHVYVAILWQALSFIKSEIFTITIFIDTPTIPSTNSIWKNFNDGTIVPARVEFLEKSVSKITYINFGEMLAVNSYS